MFYCPLFDRIGPDVVSDPAFLVTRQLQDFITWTDASAVRKQALQYNEMVSALVKQCGMSYHRH